MKSFKDTIQEAKLTREKGWVNYMTGKAVIVKIRGIIRPYHMELLTKKPEAFGYDEDTLREVIENAYGIEPEQAQRELDDLKRGKRDKHHDLFTFMEHNGWAEVVINEGMNGIYGGPTWPAKAYHKIARVLAKRYTPEQLFGEPGSFIEYGGRQTGRPAETIDDKEAWDIYVKTGKIPKRTEIGSTMAMFREGSNRMKSFTEYLKIQSFVDMIDEELSTREVDSNEFPNPITQAMRKIFTRKGKMDGDSTDDVVKVSKASLPATALLPSQSEIFMGKALGMAINGVKGGNLGAVISSDNHILDGHHRWAATLFSEPKAKIIGLKADLTIGDLIPVLRGLGDALGNSRRGAPGGGDVNIYSATIQDAIAAIREGKNMNPKFYDQAKAEEWLESIGGEDELKKRLDYIQSKRPPQGAPARHNMPVVDADKRHHVQAAGLLRKGELDVRPPYAK